MLYFEFQCIERFRPNSTILSSSLAGRRPARDQIQLRYPACDQLASSSATSSRAGRRLASEQAGVMECGLNRSATRFELSRHIKIARACLRNQVCDLDGVMQFSLSRSQTSSRASAPYSITLSSSLAGSRAGLRHAASELDSLMEFGFYWTEMSNRLMPV